jgi:Tol biopolymer transport system component
MGLSEMSLWLYDLRRGTHTKLQGEGENWWPRWTPDGERIAFRSLKGGVNRIVWRRADGTGAVETLVEGDHPSSWSPDGRDLAFVSNRNNTDIWVATLGSGQVTARVLIEGPDEEMSPEFSPDGRWLAYVSDASGRREVYVQPYPGPGPRRQVSLDGGWLPAWNPTGRELFFLSLPDDPRGRGMMSADVHLGPTLGLGKPRRLFSYTRLGFSGTVVRGYAVAPDGQFFYALQPIGPDPTPTHATQIQLVTNWVEELKAKVAAGQAK